MGRGRGGPGGYPHNSGPGMHHGGGDFGGGRGGRYGAMQMNHPAGPHVAGGPETGFSRPVGPDYVCKRCKEKGHYVTDCPQNGNPAYDNYERKGVPVDERYKELILRDIWRDNKSCVCN